jgi:hypothetical protein
VPVRTEKSGELQYFFDFHPMVKFMVFTPGSPLRKIFLVLNVTGFSCSYHISSFPTEISAAEEPCYFLLANFTNSRLSY